MNHTACTASAVTSTTVLAVTSLVAAAGTLCLRSLLLFFLLSLRIDLCIDLCGHQLYIVQLGLRARHELLGRGPVEVEALATSRHRCAMAR